MDSKAAVQFSNRRALFQSLMQLEARLSAVRLASELPGLRLPSTLVFDYPTLSALPSASAPHVFHCNTWQDMSFMPQAVAGYAADTKPKRSAVATRESPADEPMAVIGTACAFPGESFQWV